MGCSSSIENQLSEGNFHDRYLLGRKLGQGSFGQVREAVTRRSNQSFVVKILDIRTQQSPTGSAPPPWDDQKKHWSIDKERSEDARAECEIWRKIGKSKYCVDLVEVFAGAGMVYIVMERCQCSLLDKLEEMLQWTECEMRTIWRQMLLGVQHCHRHGVAHRDLKPDNYLYGLDGTVKLADFGLAGVMPRATPLGGSTALRSVVGTVPYMSPEMLGPKKYDLKTDIWSFGVCVYFMFFVEFPYGQQAKTIDEMKAAIISCRTPTYARSPQLLLAIAGSAVEACGAEAAPHAETGDQCLSFQARGFVKSLLVRDPKFRPTADKALAHDFLQVVTSATSQKWDSEESNCSIALRPLVALARAQSLNFVSDSHRKKKEDPTLDTDLDTLLLRLQQEHGAVGADMRRCFSLPIETRGGAVAVLPTLTEEQSEEHSIDELRLALLGRHRSGSSLTTLRRSITHGGETNPNTPATTLDDLPAFERNTPATTLDDLPAFDLAADRDEWVEGDWSTEFEGEDESLLPPPVPRLPRCHSTVAVGGSACTSSSGLEDFHCH